jgi:formylglycine-generating enzyme required for sulfatase activity
MMCAIEASRGGYLLLPIPSGTFVMGSPKAEEGRTICESPAHRVVVSAFHLGRFPVTNEEYRLFLEANPLMAKPSFWKDGAFNQPRQPVVGVTFDDVQLYCRWAGLRLPSEAEWEYACRARTVGRFHSGDTEEDLQRAAWYSRIAERRLHDVGEKERNAFGLYDMHGNVWEWCEDDWHDTYCGAPDDGRAWIDAERCDTRVLRGGSWFGNHSDYLRSASRRPGATDFGQFNVGFRCAA